jgi:hypothetical protein
MLEELEDLHTVVLAELEALAAAVALAVDMEMLEKMAVLV